MRLFLPFQSNLSGWSPARTSVQKLKIERERGGEGEKGNTVEHIRLTWKSNISLKGGHLTVAALSTSVNCETDVGLEHP